MEKKIFINVSNHPSNLWSAKQREAAEIYGTIMDIPFPSVDPNASEGEIRDVAEAKFREILCKYKESVEAVEINNESQLNIDAGCLTVMVQGEFTMTFALVCLLKSVNANVVAACSERVVHEEQINNGISRKVIDFEFVRFRSYGEV